MTVTTDGLILLIRSGRFVWADAGRHAHATRITIAIFGREPILSRLKSIMTIVITRFRLQVLLCVNAAAHARSSLVWSSCSGSAFEAKYDPATTGRRVRVRYQL